MGDWFRAGPGVVRGGAPQVSGFQKFSWGSAKFRGPDLVVLREDKTRCPTIIHLITHCIIRLLMSRLRSTAKGSLTLTATG